MKMQNGLFAAALMLTASAFAQHPPGGGHSAGGAMREHLNAVIPDVERLRRQNPNFFV